MRWDLMGTMYPTLNHIHPLGRNDIFYESLVINIALIASYSTLHRRDQKESVIFKCHKLHFKVIEYTLR